MQVEKYCKVCKEGFQHLQCQEHGHAFWSNNFTFSYILDVFIQAIQSFQFPFNFQVTDAYLKRYLLQSTAKRIEYEL